MFTLPRTVLFSALVLSGLLLSRSEGTVHIEEDIVVQADGDRVRIGGNIVVEAGEEVSGDVVGVFGDVRIDGTVQGDVVAVFGDLSLGPEAVVNGDVVTVLGEFSEASGAEVSGEQVEIAGFPGMPRMFRHAPWHGFLGISWLTAILAFLGYLALAAILVGLIPGRMTVMAATLKTRPGACLLVGLVTLLLTAPVALLLVITIIGIPLVAVEIAAVVLGFLVAHIVLAQAIGEGLARQQLAAAWVGLLLLLIVRLIPIISVLVLVANLFAFGALILSGIGATPSWLTTRWQKRVAPPAAPAV